MQSDWQLPPAMTAIRDNALHLWRCRTDLPDETVDQFHKLLDEEERAKAARFKHDHHRNTSIIARGLLRDVVARYLQTAPTSLSFIYNHYGKPALAEDQPRPLAFNLSHSGDWVVLAVAERAAVGVDIERRRKLDSAIKMAERFFSSQERTVLAELPENEQLAAFFRCWTRKEAYIKAVGEGIFAGLDRFDVAFAAEAAPQVLRGHQAEFRPSEWSMHDVSFDEEYSAAVLVQLRNVELTTFEWSPACGGT